MPSPFRKPLKNPEAAEMSDADIREVDAFGREIITEDDFADEEPVELAEEDVHADDTERSGAFSVPPPLRRSERKAQERRKLIDAAALQNERAVEARTIELLDGIEASFTMEKGGKRPDGERNEDSLCVFEDPELGAVGGVFDGLGGEGRKGSGAFASAKAGETLSARLKDAFEAVRDLSPASLELVAVPEVHFVVRDPETGELAHAKDEERIRQACRIDLDPAIARKAVALSHALKTINHDIESLKGDASGGKTTACVSLIHMTEDGRRFSITANVGDSGAIRRKQDGRIERLTLEDSMIDGLVEAGAVSPATLADMRAHPDKEFPFGRMKQTYRKLKLMNTQALGIDHVSPRLTIEEFHDGDELIMMTDGYLDFLEYDGELDIDAMQGALNEKDPAARLDRLTDITKLMERVQANEGSNLKQPDDKAAVSLLAKPLRAKPRRKDSAAEKS